MTLQTKYITLEDFKVYHGVDLEIRLNKDDNPSNSALAFLKRIENRMEAYLNANFYRIIEREYPEFSDYQKEHYKLALLEQAMYVFINGDISVDSGYDQEYGIKATKNQLHDIIIGENARQELMLCGLWCRKVKNRTGRYYGGWN